MARKPTVEDFHFEGFENPNTTPVPDVVFDRFLARLGEAELKALLYIIRRTFGFKRDRDPISFNQFLRGITTKDGRILDEGCGIKDRTSLSKALKLLEDKGIITSEKGVDHKGENVTTVYSLRFKANHYGGVVGIPYHRGMNNPPPVVGNSYPQETVLQQTVEQETDISNIRKASLSQKSDEIRDDHDRRRDTPQRFEKLETILAQKNLLPKPNPNDDEPRRVILAYIDDFSREFSDRAPLKSSTTRAYNLFQKSGLTIDGFIQALYQARSITRERTAAIKTTSKEPGSYWTTKHKMAYFFAILEEKLGLREEGTDPKNPTPGAPKSP